MRFIGLKIVGTKCGDWGSETARFRRHLGFLDGFALIGLGPKELAIKKGPICQKNGARANNNV